MSSCAVVLEILASGAIGGGATHLRDLVAGLDRRRFEPVVAISADGPLGDALAAGGVAVHSVAMTSRINPLAIARLRHLIASLGVGLIHCHGTRAALCGVPAARLAGVPVVYTVHGWSFHARGARLAERLATEIERGLCALSQQVICVSVADRENGLLREVLAAKKSVVIPNGVEAARFELPADGGAGVRHELGLAPDALVVTQVARLIEQKQQAVLVEAVALLATRFPALRLLLVGDGPDRERLEALVGSLGLVDQVVFAGAREDVPEVLAASDAMALPSLWEGLPIALLEAMAAGLPVVASDVDGNHEVLSGQLGGLLVPPRDAPALAAALAALLEDPARRRRLGARGREAVARRYRLDRMLASTQRLYRQVLEAVR